MKTLSIALSIPFLAASVLVIDLLLPLGVAAAIGYVPVVLVSLALPNRRAAYITALSCSALTIAAFVWSPDSGGTEPWKVVTNRSLALFVIWVTAVLGLQRKAAEDELAARRGLDRPDLLTTTLVQDRTLPRARSYVILAVLLGLACLLLEQTVWRGTTQLHTIMEVTATMLAVFVSAVALLRFYSRKSNEFLFIGIGFVGTAMLDGYHAVVTSSFFNEMFPSPPRSLIPWSWNASRTFLAVLMCVSWWAWKREKRLGAAGRIGERAVYAITGLLTIGTFCFFAFVPLPRAYYAEYSFGRPQEFVAAAIFLMALVGYLHKKTWRYDSFDSWIVMSLIVGVVCQAVAMSRSFTLFDTMFDTAHLLKLLSYTLVAVGLLISMHDLFRRAERSEELNRANEALERSNLELQRFAYVASHDLQEPLRSISGFCQLLERRYKGQLDEQADEWIHFVTEGASRMQTLVQDLLAYSRVDHRARPFEPVDCSVALEDALANLHSSIEESGAQVTSDGLPTVRGDPPQLVQLLQNLMSNGIKFRSAGSPRIHVSARRDGTAWEFTVRDNGIGIQPDHRDRIFEIFRRLHPREKYPGTGLGLAVCRRIVDRHGGRIWVESEPGNGSVFHFTIADEKEVIDDQ